MNQSKEPNGVLFAVYGTLRQNHGNNRLLRNQYSEYLGTERTTPNYKMVSLGGFPGVIENGNQQITIEVFRVTHPEVEANLDALEGYPHFYGRTTIETQWGTANMYVLDENRYGSRPIVVSGDWNEYIGKKVN